MDAQLATGLTFLSWTSSVLLLIVGIFALKLIIDLSVLIRNLNKSAKIINNEIEPIMKNINESTTAINDVVKSVGGKVEKINKTYDKISDIVLGAASKATTLSGVFVKSLLKGFYSVFKKFTK